MKINTLGRAGIQVSELCFGILPMGCLQADMDSVTGGKLILAAMEKGITFFDTAQMYGTYTHLRYALDRFDGDVVISGKSTASSYEEMAAAIDEGLAALDRDNFDFFLLHAARIGSDILEQRAGAWQCLKDYKAKGKLKAIGVSTHNVSSVNRLADDEDTDIIFCLYNKSGLGILEGTPEDMLKAAQNAAAKDKGVYSMKLLAGGNLLNDLLDAIEFGRREECFAAHAIGMVKPGELEMNMRIFNDENIEAKEIANLKNSKQWQLMEFVCIDCGKCIRDCHSDALYLLNEKPHLIKDKCVLCGYCAAECPVFAIRVR